MSPTTKPAPRTCGSSRCRHCRTVRDEPRALTTDDLRWHFSEAESALGIRSTLGAFVDMALSGLSGGGRGNAVEDRAVEPRRLAATGRHRCIRDRLRHLPPSTVEVLRAAYGADDWTNAVDDLQVRGPLRRAFGELVGVVLLTPEPLAHAARRQAPADKPCADAEAAEERADVTRTASGTVLCAYRRPALAPAPKDRPSQRRRAATSADAARAYLERDPALAGSARGWVISAACGDDDARRLQALRAARALLAAARGLAGVIEASGPRPGRIRSVQLAPARPFEAYLPSDGEALAHV